MTSLKSTGRLALRLVAGLFCLDQYWKGQYLYSEKKYVEDEFICWGILQISSLIRFRVNYKIFKEEKYYEENKES